MSAVEELPTAQPTGKDDDSREANAEACGSELIMPGRRVSHSESRCARLPDAVMRQRHAAVR
jgi:hypothetical protein